MQQKNIRFEHLGRGARRPPLTILAAVGLSSAFILDFFDRLDAIPLAAVLLAIWFFSARISQSTLKFSAACLVAVVIGGIVSEVVYRIAFIETPDEFITRRLAHINPSRQPDVVRILGLSDSFGVAGGMQHNYHSVLERLLADADQRCEIVNVSVYAMEPPDQLKLLRTLGPRYDPDVVLHGFFVGNDFEFPERPIYFTNTGGAVRDSKGLSRLRPKKFLIRKWFRSWYETKKARREARAESTDNEGSIVFSVEQFLSIERDRLEFFRRVPSAEETFDKTLKVIDQIREEAARLNARYVMVIHPDQLQVEQALIEDLEAEFDLNLADFDLTLLQRLLIEHCERTDTPCLDLLPLFRSAGSEGGLYLLRNTHYNRNGNRMAAEAIADFLLDSELIGTARE